MPLTITGLCPLLQVFDMPTSLAFYRDVLGFEVAQRSSPGDDCDWVLLKLCQAELMLNTAHEAGDRPPSPDPARVRSHGDTAIFIGCPDVDAAYQYLRGRGLHLAKPVVASYGMKQLYLKDPDGYELCLQWSAK